GGGDGGHGAREQDTHASRVLEEAEDLAAHPGQTGARPVREDLLAWEVFEDRLVEKRPAGFLGHAVALPSLKWVRRDPGKRRPPGPVPLLLHRSLQARSLGSLVRRR